MLTLLANNVEAFLHRAAAVADAEGAAEASALASLSSGIGFPYGAGEAAAAPGGLPGYVLTKVGPFVYDYEKLADGHLARGSETAALVTCERTQGCFGAWGRPFAFHSRMLRSLSRDEEARDKARSGLELPLWTLGDDIDEILQIACMERGSLVAKLQEKADGKLSPEELRAQVRTLPDHNARAQHCSVPTACHNLRVVCGTCAERDGEAHTKRDCEGPRLVSPRPRRSRAKRVQLGEHAGAAC